MTIPAPVRLLLRQQAAFGCCACGHPFTEYHHITPRSVEDHNRPEDMMALCPTCHHQATVGAVDEEQQRAWKATPYNMTRGYTQGQLVYSARQVALQVGTTLLVGNGAKLLVDDVPLLRIRTDRNRKLLLSIDLRDANDAPVLTVVDNDWVTGATRPWDIEYRFNYLRIRSAPYQVSLELDARTQPIKLVGHLPLRGQTFELGHIALQGHSSQGGGIQFLGLGLVLGRIVLSSDGGVESGPDPGFGRAVIVSQPPDRLLAASLAALDKELRQVSCGQHQPCPCGSGEKWKDCCKL